MWTDRVGPLGTGKSERNYFSPNLHLTSDKLAFWEMFWGHYGGSRIPRGRSQSDVHPTLHIQIRVKLHQVAMQTVWLRLFIKLFQSSKKNNSFHVWTTFEDFKSAVFLHLLDHLLIYVVTSKWLISGKKKISKVWKTLLIPHQLLILRQEPLRSWAQRNLTLHSENNLF